MKTVLMRIICPVALYSFRRHVKANRIVAKCICAIRILEHGSFHRLISLTIWPCSYRRALCIRIRTHHRLGFTWFQCCPPMQTRALECRSKACLCASWNAILFRLTSKRKRCEAVRYALYVLSTVWVDWTGARCGLWGCASRAGGGAAGGGGGWRSLLLPATTRTVSGTQHTVLSSGGAEGGRQYGDSPRPTPHGTRTLWAARWAVRAARLSQRAAAQQPHGIRRLEPG